MIPEIHTERLILRGPQMADYAGYAEFWKSPRSTHIHGPLPDWAVWLQFAAMVGHWDARGFGWWTLVDRASGRVAGWCGLFQPPHYPDPELGWIVAGWAEGQGIAHEAALAARHHGQAVLKMPRIVSYISGANTRSSRLAERLGAEVIVTDSFDGKPFHIYLHPAAAVPA